MRVAVSDKCGLEEGWNVPGLKSTDTNEEDQHDDSSETSDE
jgi:hypothetical protein